MRVQPVSWNNSNRYNNNVSVTSMPVFTAGIRTLNKSQHSELKVFLHHIYEYKKGLRSLILTTEKASNKDYIVERLEREKIPYVINPAGERTINVFFGNEQCIKVVSTFDKRLNKLSPEHDFMLGIMLGYDKIIECTRYLKKIGLKPNSAKG